MGNLARGQSVEIDFGGVEFACATGRFDVLTVRCLHADGSPGAVLIEYDRSFLCQECTP